METNQQTLSPQTISADTAIQPTSVLTVEKLATGETRVQRGSLKVEISNSNNSSSKTKKIKVKYDFFNTCVLII